MYLLDTNIPSEIRRGSRANAGVVRWIDSVGAEGLHLSVISVLELRYGAARLESDDPRQAHRLHEWIDQDVLPIFATRILPVNLQIVELCARLHLPHRREDGDALIAATALHHDLTIVTRNERHFEGTGTRILNPWD
jgi:predicted nucleic acid-binding protein